MADGRNNTGKVPETADALFRQGNEALICGKYLAAARAFRDAAAAGHPEAPQDCSILIDAMIGGTVAAARAIFRREADCGSPFAACCHFLSWLNFCGELRDFDLFYAEQALKQAKMLGSEHSVLAAADFYGETAYSGKFQEFAVKMRKCRANPDCMRILGDIHSLGIGVRADKKKAAHYYSAGADANALCSYRLALLYLQGEIKSGGNGLTEIFGLLPKKENAPAESLLEAGKILLSKYKELGKKQEEAVPYIEKSSEKGNMEARRIFGKMLFYGRFMPQDKELGLRLMDEAHISGNRTASLDSGLAYYYHGMLQKEANMKIAMNRFAAAAESGIAEGWKMLGRMFLLGETGEGRTGRGKRDEAHARKCFNQAALLGDITAGYDLAQVFYNRASAADFAKAYSLFANLASAGHVQSQYRAALMLADGIGVEKDMKRAKQLLENASSQGHAEATWKLFEFALLETPVKEKPEKVLDLLLYALRLGSVSAYLFVKNGKKSDHLPVMLKESIFSNFLCNMKELMLSGEKKEEALGFFIFALKNADIIVPLEHFSSISEYLRRDYAGLEENHKRVMLADLGRKIMGSDKWSCAAVLRTVAMSRFCCSKKMFPEKEKSSDCVSRPEIFCFFTKIENIPVSWKRKYRFLQLPAQRTLEKFFSFKMSSGFPDGLALDPSGKMLVLHESSLFLMDNLVSLTKYFVPPPPEEYRW